MATSSVTIYEQPGFGGRSKSLGVGTYRLSATPDFNDVISSIRIPPGFAAILFEHADDGGGYGISVDLLEDWPDLSTINFNDKASYINVFSTDVPLYVWIRGSMQSGQFVGGHWERQRASGPPPPNPVAVVSPPYPPHTATPVTTIQVNGPEWAITTLGVQDMSDASGWDYAMQNQAGVIGSDFRGVEEIGSAAFERGANNKFLPDNLNFWYPQKQANDHRTVVYFKRTLAGHLKEVHIARIEGTYEDHDVNIDIVPDEHYRYLLTDSHPREYTDIMSLQWNGTAHQMGQPNCDDAASRDEFTFIEAEIQVDSDPHAGGAQLLNDMLLGRQTTICMYGPWIYDKGHCCHAEIHPAEQVWFRDDLPNGVKRYSLNVFCDASGRFLWRDQMDDGTKLRPWGAPPIRGTFAIAFEVSLYVGAPGLIFEVADVDSNNVAVNPNSNHTSSLTYKGRTLVQFIPHNDAFKVSFEHVAVHPGQGPHPDTVRGFLVLETTVGSSRQKATQAADVTSTPPRIIQFPMGQDVDKIDQRFERQIFEKLPGHYMFTVTQTTADNTVDPGPIKTLIDLNGTWASGGAPGPVVSVHGNSIAVDMSAYHRPAAQGTVVGEADITVTFPDDKTYTGKLQPPRTIQWSNSSTWTKV